MAKALSTKILCLFFFPEKTLKIIVGTKTGKGAVENYRNP